ncbi:MAG: sigma-70 family RNA polymerase sigma factor [Myxococcales bacterium]|nr:sigma-70 family RNA polymerase sigma factor [Myxococcales bacterium]
MAPTTPSTASERAPNGWPRTRLQGFKAGERQALTEVYREHVDEVALLLRHGFSFESAGRHHRFVGYQSGFELQDVLHETFRRAFEPRARESYDGIRPYGPYVKTIARNLVLRSFRAREVLFPVDDGASASTGGAPVVVDEGPTPERAVHDRQVQELVAAFLAGLDEEDRRLITLRFEQGLSQRDAADAMSLGRQRVRTREKQLRQQLLVFLREQGEVGLIDGVVANLALPVLLAEALRVLAEVSR